MTTTKIVLAWFLLVIGANDLLISPGRLLGAEQDQLSLNLVLPTPTVDEQRDENRDRVLAAAFSPSGRTLVLGMESGRVVVWDILGKRAV